MVLINKAINEVTVKLVYYGPGLCGKTTNLEKIYANPKLDNKGKMISMSTETDRTLFFDFMPMELGTIAGQKVRVQLYTVPGQVFYDATRKLVLRGADGVVFVADSQESMRESNIDSLENLKTNLRLNRIDPDKIALVFQYNKRDLPNIAAVDEINEYLKPGAAPVTEAAAINGVGVTATLRTAVARILDNVRNNVDTTLYAEPPLGPPDLSQRAGVTSGSAGTPKLSMKTEPEPATPPLSEQAPFHAPLEPEPIALSLVNPFDADATLTASEVRVDLDAGAAVEAEPFAHVAVIEEPPMGIADDPFGAVAVEVHEASGESAQLEELLANTTALIASLETALERAKENERVLRRGLSGIED